MARKQNPSPLLILGVLGVAGAVGYYFYTKSAATALATANGGGTSGGTTVPINPYPDESIDAASGLGALHRHNPHIIGPGMDGEGQIFNVFGNPVWSGRGDRHGWG